jgi:tetratricopeptide (TPR) repeat protein
MKKVILVLFCVFSTHLSFSNEREQALAIIENEFLKNLDSKSLSKSERFQYYNLAARELYNFNFYKKSSEYYKKAIALNTKEDLTEAYINLMAIDHATLGKVKEETYKKALNYFKSSKKINETGIKKYMGFIESNFINKSSKKEFKGFYGQYSIDTNVKDLIKNKNYKKALSFYNDKNMVSNDINTRLTYDILRSLVYGKNKSYLYCARGIENQSKFSWITMSCRVLLNYQKGRKPSSKELGSIKKSMELSDSMNKYYLISTLGELK